MRQQEHVQKEKGDFCLKNIEYQPQPEGGDFQGGALRVCDPILKEGIQAVIGMEVKGIEPNTQRKAVLEVLRVGVVETVGKVAGNKLGPGPDDIAEFHAGINSPKTIFFRCGIAPPQFQGDLNQVRFQFIPLKRTPEVCIEVLDAIGRLDGPEIGIIGINPVAETNSNGPGPLPVDGDILDETGKHAVGEVVGSNIIWSVQQEVIRKAQIELVLQVPIPGIGCGRLRL